MRTLLRIRRLYRVTLLGLAAVAVATELARPAQERTWHGKVLGVVPYDFRPPTWERIRDAYWNPHSGRLFSDRVFGVGWTVNLYRAKELLEDAFRQLVRSEEPVSIKLTVRASGSGRNPNAVTGRD
jgi:hypothetical protein